MAILNVITLDEETNELVKNPLPDPQTLQWDSADIEAEGCSGTNQLGEYFRDVIGNKVTLGVTWGLLTDEEISQLFKYINNTSFVLEYPDAQMGERIQVEVYVNSRTAPMYCYTNEEEEGQDSWKWQGLSISFMEV